MLQVNPKHTKRTKEITDNSPNKTDQKDPKVIAHLIWMQKGLTVNIAKGTKSNLRNYIHFRDRIQKDLNQLLNQVEAYLAIYFPEFLQVFRSLQSKTALYILQHYPTPEDIAHSNAQQFEEELHHISRGQVDKEKTAKIRGIARSSIGIQEGVSSYLVLIGQLLDQIYQLRNQKKAIEQAIVSELDTIPESRILLSVKGVGSISAAAILGEMGDFNDFRTINEVNKYAGFNLYELSSGKSQSTRKITKRGRALLRKTLYFTTLNMIKKGGIFYDDYQRHLSKGMPRKKAQIAIARKLLRMLFAMVRDNTCYKETRKKSAEKAA
jgi:transposase